MKSSVLALALFLFLFALASKPSLAARHDASLLRTEGNEYFVSALREFVQDGLNLVMSGSHCPKQKSWPELVGINGKVAAAIIEKENPCLYTYICPSDQFSANCNTADYRPNRVRIVVNEKGIVMMEPRIG